jgi:hypothetical protein
VRHRGAQLDQFGGRVAMHGPVQLVLHGGEEVLAQLVPRVVVDAGGIDVGDLLVEQPLRGPDVADALQQFVEVVSAQRAPGLEALVVEGEAFGQQFRQACRSPLAKGCAPM